MILKELCWQAKELLREVSRLQHQRDQRLCRLSLRLQELKSLQAIVTMVGDPAVKNDDPHLLASKEVYCMPVSPFGTLWEVY